MESAAIRNNLPDVIGKGYNSFWKCKKRYRVVKGSRGSKKSATTALWFIWNILKYPLANALIIRRFFNTHKDSTFAQLKWAMRKLHVAHLFECSKNPLEIRVKATGQKIMFRGLDNPDSVTSVTVETGVLCWVWVEEAFQITNESDFDKLDTSIRGEVPEGYFKQLTLTFNPWSAKHWLKSRFFDNVDDDSIFAITTTYRCNEWLDEADIKLFEWMKIHNPRRFRIEGNGDWGISEGLIYDNWREEEFNWKEMLQAREWNTQKFLYEAKFGLDFGYTNDPTAFIALLVDKRNKYIYIFDEIYKTRLKNSEIVATIDYKGFKHEKIIADSEDPRTIDDLKETYGLSRVVGAKKGKGSIQAGIQRLQDYTIIVHPRCTNTIIELSNYTYAVDKDGKTTNEPIDEYNHLMDAFRYATEDLTKSKFSFE